MHHDQTVLESVILGITPFEQPDTALVIALARAGALGILDVGRDPARSREALAALARALPRGFGVRIPEYVDMPNLPAAARVVVLPARVAFAAHTFGERTVLVQVTSIAEARAAVAFGAHGLIVKGNESGGRVGDETSLVLLQRVVSELRAGSTGSTGVPVWVQGGVGLHGAAACIAGGARGVVLDAQLALLEESSTPAETRRAIAAMDGSETQVVADHRIFSRPGALAPAPGASPRDVATHFGATDLARELLAAGQDAAFAKGLADRFRTTGGVVRALRAAIASHLNQARVRPPLGAGSRFAAAHGVTYPIAQGPMTRVSDRAPFARAVADAGALPFLALSLMRGAEASALLEQTAEMLGARPWGVGVLGFLPQDVRDEQLALLQKVRPPVVIIAGGRPSQARPLEAAGIVTYLHVPSPGLLDLFLKDGARRFVFEGRECGGHVGPRSSFVLWEMAIERLLAMDDVRDVSVLFAGGIHDGRSAAMVSAMAAPLAARGAHVGVLMGTAYLFTDEAVTAGAITRTFQDEALRCSDTVLVETAPGHATRCADSDFVRAFQAERDRLAREGVSAQEAWAALEQLNLGRLRIAAKGLRRDGDAIVHVDDEVQRREGMFMIGQVASLRRERLGMAALHADVIDGATAILRETIVPAASTGREPPPVDVAIVGMACIFPDAPDLAAFWKNVTMGTNAIREVPAERWSADLYYDPAGTGEKTPSKWGGFLPDVAFDPGKYGIPPRSLAAIDPAQLLSLEVAHRALVDAGYADRDFDRERTSVVFGAESGTDLSSAYGFRAAYPHFLGALPAELDAHLPTLTEDSFPGVLSNVIAGRIANRLDLGGVNYTVDAACASSLAALDVACKELASGTSDMVISGGADLHNSINDYLLFASVHALSPTGQCRTFDAAADGIALGEGVAAVVLKRLADAERDGDRVYAVIKGIGGSSDGKSLGLTAPRREGQSRALERAYARAGVSPVDVGLVEAHGTGTVVGDRTELAALGDFFGAAGAHASSCTLGSVKSQIGHTKCAAGLAGLIKAALAVHRGVLPPTKNIAKPNPGYDGASSPFVFRDAASPWAASERRAGVSAFGFGGTNFHVVLEAHRGESLAAPVAGLDEWPAELFLFRGADVASALAAVRAFEARLDDDAPHRLRDLARTLAVVAEPGPVQIAIVADSVTDLRKKLQRAHASSEAPADAGVFVASPRAAGVFGDDAVAFLFPGQGSQRPGMMADLFVAFPELHDLLRLGARFTDRLFPPAAFTPEERAAQQRAITDTRVAQPVLGMVDLAVARLLSRAGVKPAMTAGHSYGELVALTVAGALPARALVDLSARRAECILSAALGDGGAPGTMAAVRASAATVEAALEGLTGVVLANHNAPDQVVIAGTDQAVRDACERLAARAITARGIPVACAFHSPIVAAASETFAAHLEAVQVTAPRVPVFANTTAGPYPTDAAGIRFQLARQLALPVRFADQIEAMYAAGARVFVEAGPGGVLSDLVGRTLGGRPHVAIPCDGGAGSGGLRAFLVALARLAVAGVSVDPAALFEGRDAHLVPLEAPRTLAPTTWIVNGHTARPLHGELPPFAMKPLTAPLAIANAPGAHASIAIDREATVLEYMQGMREMVEAQRQVMLRYLGSAAEVTDADAALTLRPAARTSAPAAKAKNGTHRHVNGHASAHAITTMLPPAPQKPLDALIATVSERTGYPADMLDPDLDLEADLGIDSIKRIEILGTMSEKLGLRLAQKDGPSEAVEELAGVKTLRGIASWLEKRLGVAPEASAASVTATPAAEDAAPASSSSSSSTPPPSSSRRDSEVGRYVLSVGPLPHAVPNGVTVDGKRFAIVRDSRGVATRLAARLEERGATVRIVSPGEALGAVDGLVFLDSLASGSPGSLKSLFTMAKEAALGDAKWIVAATGLGGSFGRGDTAPGAMHGGVAGLLKSIAKEWPELRVHAIDLHPDEDPAQLADHVYAELLANDARVEVGYAAGVRQTLSVLPGPPSGPPDASSLDIDRDSVVLITGGARGITARVAIAMAQRFQCRLELVGRSPAPDEDEDPELAAAGDAIALRKALLARANGAGPTTPAAIDAMCNQILAAREIRATFAAIRAAGAELRYHAVDVRDEAAFGAVVDGIYARHGRLDGVVHGAGLVEDKLLRHKTQESFDRVYDTKVSSALTLSAKLRGDARFVVFFSSVSGAFGNRGQVDYAAANAALDTLAHHMDRKIAARVLSINWGPWGGVGMVRPELEREYARQGVGLIAPEDGVARFFEELCLHKDSQVILSASAPGLLQ